MPRQKGISAIRKNIFCANDVQDEKQSERRPAVTRAVEFYLLENQFIGAPQTGEARRRAAPPRQHHDILLICYSLPTPVILLEPDARPSPRRGNQGPDHNLPVVILTCVADHLVCRLSAPLAYNKRRGVSFYSLFIIGSDRQRSGFAPPGAYRPGGVQSFAP